MFSTSYQQAPMKNLKEIIQKKIKEKGLTMTQFTDLIGITRTAIYKLYNENSTSVETLEKIAEVLEMSVGDFFESKNIVEEPPVGYTTIKNEELIELQKMALGNLKKELEQTKNIENVSDKEPLNSDLIM